MSDTPSVAIVNASVVTLSPLQPEADAVAFENGLITWVGKSADAPRTDRQIDAAGRTVLPGLIDAHSHLYWMAKDRLELSVGAPKVRNFSDLLDLLNEERKKNPGDDWIQAVGLSEYALAEGRLPTRAELDKIDSGRPIAIKRVCGHAAIVNSAGLARIGLTDDAPDPFGGIIERDGGRLTGVLRERATEQLFRVLPVSPPEVMAESLDVVARNYLACGVTGATEAAVGFTCDFDREWEAWQQVRRRGQYGLRMAFMLRLDAGDAALRNIGPGQADLDWQVDTLKFFADGTVGSRTAALSSSYEASTSTGLLMQPSEILVREIGAAHRSGWNVAVHAIGDAAIELTVDAIRSAQDNFAAHRRHRIEHLALPSSRALSKLEGRGIAIVPQYGFLRAMGDGFIRALGPARAEALYPAQSLLGRGIVVAGSSDAPATPLSPFVGLAAAMNRTTLGGTILNSGECLSGEQALLIYTSSAAQILGHETKRGMLQPGRVADLVIVDRDPCKVSASEVLETKVKATFVRGALAYENIE